MTNVYYLTVLGNQESRHWLRVSHEVVVKDLAKLQPSEGLEDVFSSSPSWAVDRRLPFLAM